MIIVDASVAVKWFAPEIDQAEALAGLGSEEALVAPDLILAETMHALRKKARRGEISEQQFLRAGSALVSFLDDLVPCSSVVEEACRLAVRLDHGVYDCVYLAVALASDGKLTTADETFAAKVSAAGLGSTVRSWQSGLGFPRSSE